MSQSGWWILQSLWLALPVAVAGVLHALLIRKNRLQRLARPLDGGRSWRGRRLLGDNKTWRGVLLMPLLSTLVALLQGAALQRWALDATLAPLPYVDVGRAVVSQLPADLAAVLGYGVSGLIFGLGYVLGELPNSFVKRRLDVAPGGAVQGRLRWLFQIVDQGDSIVCGFVAGVLVLDLAWPVALVGTPVLCLLHQALAMLFHARQGALWRRSPPLPRAPADRAEGAARTAARS
jgi:hypothetical protein